MKRIKKLSVMLLCCLLLSVIAMPVSASAAKLNKKSISLNVGKTYTLKASGTKGKITWTSSKKSVATVSSKGVVKAKKKGTAVITAKYGKKKLTCKVTVKQPVTTIRLNKTSASLKENETLALQATVSPNTANNKGVTWSSNNTKIATVSSTGVVKGVSTGTAIITATAKDGSGKKASCNITIISAVPQYTTVELNMDNWHQYIEIIEFPQYKRNAFDELDRLSILKAFVVKQQYMNKLDTSKSSVNMEISYRQGHYIASVNLEQKTYQILENEYMFPTAVNTIITFYDASSYANETVPIYMQNKQYYGEFYANAFTSSNFQTDSKLLFYPSNEVVTRVKGTLYFQK